MLGLQEGFCLIYKGKCMIGCDCLDCILNLSKQENNLKTIGEIIRESDDSLADFYVKSLAKYTVTTWKAMGRTSEQIQKDILKYYNSTYVDFRCLLDFEVKDKEMPK